MVSDQTVFRFEVFCTSKQLGSALASLHGQVLQVSPPQMAPQVKAKGNGSALMRPADLIELFVVWLQKKKLTEFRPAAVREFLQEHGRSANSYSYLLTHMKAAGIVKNLGHSPSTSRWVLAASKPKSKSATTKKKTARPRARTNKPQPTKAAEA